MPSAVLAQFSRHALEVQRLRLESPRSRIQIFVHTLITMQPSGR